MYGHNAPAPLQSGNMLQGSGSRVTDPSATPTVARQGGWRIVVTRMSNPLPSHDPAQLDGPRLLLAGHLNYFKTGTDAAWKSRPAADNWNLSIYALLSLSHPVLLDISESESLYNLFMLAHHHAAALRLSSILPKSLHLPRTQTSIFMPTFIQPHKQLIPHLSLIVSRRNDKLLVNLTCSM